MQVQQDVRQTNLSFKRDDWLFLSNGARAKKESIVAYMQYGDETRLWMNHSPNHSIVDETPEQLDKLGVYYDPKRTRRLDVDDACREKR